MSEFLNKSIQKLSAQSIQALRAGRHSDAIELAQQVIDRQDDHTGAHAVQFSSLFKSKQFEEARRMGARAAELNPKSVFILNNQACLQLEAKQPAAAAGLLKSLIDQFGERAQWLYNLALAQRMVGNFEYAIDKFRRTLVHQPDHDRAAFQLADCLQIIGHRQEAVRAYDYVRLLRTKHAPTHSNFIHHAVANNSFSERGLSQELDLWRERFIPKKMRYKVDQPSDALNIKTGFLIGTIPEKWLNHIVVPIVNELVGRNDLISVYWHAEKAPPEDFVQEVNVILSANMSDADFARKVRADQIDVMIDVCGMRQGSRQRALGLHLAGRQFGWLAHEGRYATPLVQPLDEMMNPQRFYIMPPTKPTKIALESTLIGINCARGLADEVIKTWANLLHQLPNWKLHLDAVDDCVIKLLRQNFAEYGVDDQLVFDPQYGATLGSIVLDNFIENDPVAAAHTLEAGGILVALRGPLFPAQQSAALLTQMGKDDWIYTTISQYASRVIALAGGASAEPLTLEQLELSRIQNLQTFATHFRNTISN